MPNYEYQCTECKHLFEIWQPVGEAAPTCPECGSLVKKIFHVPRVIFKGSGFYVTDLRTEQAAQKSGGNGKSKSAEGGEATASSSESAPTTTSSDTPKSDTPKSETKTETAPAKTASSDNK